MSALAQHTHYRQQIRVLLSESRILTARLDPGCRQQVDRGLTSERGTDLCVERIEDGRPDRPRATREQRTANRPSLLRCPFVCAAADSAALRETRDPGSLWMTPTLDPVKGTAEWARGPACWRVGAILSNETKNSRTRAVRKSPVFWQIIAVFCRYFLTACRCI